MAKDSQAQSIIERFTSLLDTAPELESMRPAEEVPPTDAPKDEEGGQEEEQDQDEGQQAEDDTEGEESPDEETTDADNDDEGTSDDEDTPEQDDDAGDEEEGETEEVWTVKVNGEDVEVTTDELINGYSRQSDYSRKTAKLSEERKEFVEERTAVKSERKRYAETLGKLDATLEAMLPKEPDWAKLKTDNPSQYAIKREEWRQVQDQRKLVQDEYNATVEAETRQVLQERQETRDAERVKLVDAIPSWKDEKVRNAELGDMIDYARQLGYSDDDLNNVENHREFLLLRDGMLYQKLQGKKPLVRKKTRKAPTLKPGASKKAKPKTSNAQRNREQLKKSGSIRDAANVFLESL